MSMKLISTTTLGSNAANIEFTNIPQTYTDLVIMASGRTTQAGPADDYMLTFNGSTANFTHRYLQGNGSSASSGTSTNRLGILSAANNTSNTFGSLYAYIPNYAGSTNKSISVDTAQETNGSTAYMEINAVLWSNTAAITSIKLTSVYSENFVTGTTVSLYGITKGSDGITTAS